MAEASIGILSLRQAGLNLWAAVQGINPPELLLVRPERRRLQRRSISRAGGDRRTLRLELRLRAPKGETLEKFSIHHFRTLPVAGGHSGSSSARANSRRERMLQIRFPLIQPRRLDFRAFVIFP